MVTTEYNKCDNANCEMMKLNKCPNSISYTTIPSKKKKNELPCDLAKKSFYLRSESSPVECFYNFESEML